MVINEMAIRGDGGWELWHYLQIIGKRLWFVVLCAVVASGTSYIISTYLLIPSYRASTTLLVKTADMTAAAAAERRFNDYDTFLANEYMTVTFKELALKRPVLAAASQRLGMTPEQLIGKFNIDIIPKTPLLVLSFESADPQQAMRATNEMAAALIEVTGALVWMPGRQLVVIEEAVAPRTPASPRVLLNTLVAAGAGIALALTITIFAEYIRFARNAQH